MVNSLMDLIAEVNEEMVMIMPNYQCCAGVYVKKLLP